MRADSCWRHRRERKFPGRNASELVSSTSDPLESTTSQTKPATVGTTAQRSAVVPRCTSIDAARTAQEASIMILPQACGPSHSWPRDAQWHPRVSETRASQSPPAISSCGARLATSRTPEHTRTAYVMFKCDLQTRGGRVAIASGSWSRDPLPAPRARRSFVPGLCCKPAFLTYTAI